MQSQPSGCKSDNLKRSSFFLIRMETGRLRKNHPSKNVYVKIKPHLPVRVLFDLLKRMFFLLFPAPLIRSSIQLFFARSRFGDSSVVDFFLLGRLPERDTVFSSWWLSQPLWKICSSNWESSLGRDENKKSLKPPPSFLLDDNGSFNVFFQSRDVWMGVPRIRTCTPMVCSCCSPRDSWGICFHP